MSMAKEDVETSLTSTGNVNASFRHRDGEPRTACSPQAANKSPPILHRLSARGQPVVVVAALVVYGSLFLVSRLEAQRRQAELGYCNRDTIELGAKPPQTTGHQHTQLRTDPLASGYSLSLALPAASEPQRQRMVQQAKEAIQLFRYHCRSMQLFSSDFQSLLMVANGAGILTLGIVAWLSRQARRDELQWPLPLILTSACSFTLALVTIKTFNLQENMLNSRSLTQQSRGIARSYATSIANQSFREGSGVQGLDTSSSLAQFLEQMDNRLSRVDRSEFVISDQLDETGARLLYQRILPSRK